MSNAELFKKVFGIYAEEFWAYSEEKMLDWLTSDVPEMEVGDTISRQAAIDAAMNDSLIINAMDSVKDGDIHRTKRAIVRLLASLPHAQPEQQWVPIKTRPMTEEERRYWEEHTGLELEAEDAVLFDCQMPEDGQEIWVCSKCGNVWQDTCVVDEGIGLEDNGDWDDIVAWMPFVRPEPWKGE